MLINFSVKLKTKIQNGVGCQTTCLSKVLLTKKKNDSQPNHKFGRFGMGVNIIHTHLCPYFVISRQILFYDFSIFLPTI